MGNEPKFVELETALKELLQEALGLLRAKGYDQSPPMTSIRTADFPESGGAVQRTEVRIDLGRLWQEGVDGWAQAATFERLLHVIQEDEQLRNDLLVDASGQPLPEEHQSGWLTNYAAGMALFEYLRSKPSLEWDDSVFDRIASDLVLYIAEETFPILMVAPLFNFESTEDRAELSTDCWLQRLSPLERKDLYETSTTLARVFSGVYDVLPLTHAVVARWPTRKHSSVDVSVAGQLVDDAVHALRMTGPNRMGVIFEFIRPERFIVEQTAFMLGSGLQPSFSGPKYTLQHDQVPIVKAAFEALHSSQAKSQKGFSLALRRFDSAYARVADDDRIIDFWVALEALFLSDTSRELSYRAALRIARFLGDSSDDRKAIFTLAKKSYDARSKVAHGATPPANIGSICEETESLLRRALLRWAESSPAPTPKSLDAPLLA